MDNQNVKIYEVKKTTSDEDFIRTVVVGLGTSSETPNNVFDGQFGKITCENHHFVSMGGSAKVHCSASIGHDYQVEKEEYNHFTKKYETVQRTETQWSPYQTTYLAEDTVGFAENKENPDSNDARAFRKLIANIRRDELITIDEASEAILAEKGFTEVKDEALQASLEDMKADAIRQSKKALPGDRYKDFSASVDADVRYGANYVVPCHHVTYTYSGVPYPMKAYANGECIVRGSIPTQSEGVTLNNSNKLGKLAKGVSLVLSLLLMICAMISLQGSVLPWIVAALATVAFVLYKWMDIWHRKKLNHKKVNTKKAAVIKILAARGLRPLSEEEQKKFNSIYKNGHKRKMTFGDAFTLIFYIVSLGLFLLNYDSNALVHILMLLMFVGISALIIYGLSVAFKKNSKT